MFSETDFRRTNDAAKDLFGHLGAKYRCAEAANRFFENGRTIQEFTEYILRSKLGATPATGPGAFIGMSAREVQSYSLVRAINKIANREQLDGLEAEVSAEVAKNLRVKPDGFMVPLDITTRALTAGTAGSGGYTVGTQMLASEMVELLRNRSAVVRLGATTLSGLQGNVAIPRHTGGATAYWLDETTAVTASQQAFGQLALVPHRVAGQTVYTKQLLKQASLDVEGFVRGDLMTTIALAKDKAAVQGSGAAGEPLGILNTTGIKTVTFGGAPTWAKIVEFETEVSSANALQGGRAATLTTAAVRGKLKVTEKVSSTGIYIWSDANRLNGYPAEVSEQVPGNKLIFADWSQLIMADWDGLDIVVDPYTLAAENQVKITVNGMADVALRHVESFCASTDSGAQ